MAEKSILDHPGDIYQPFTDAERKALSEYVENVRRLGKMRFFDQVPKKASITYQDDGGTNVDMNEPDDEAIRAAVTAFRQVYNSNEPISASFTLNSLKRSVRAHGGPHQAEALRRLKELREWVGEILDRGIGLGIVFDNGKTEQRISPRVLLDTYFHGRYLHSGNDKAELAERLDALNPWARYTLYSVIWKLTRAYWVIANVAELAVTGTPRAAGAELLS